MTRRLRSLLGASGWQTFFYVTLPNRKTGAALWTFCSATRAPWGEFGAVAVISGKLRGETVTMPLQIELYHQEFRALAQVAAFSMAAVLAGLCARYAADKNLGSNGAMPTNSLRREADIKEKSMELAIRHVRKEFDRFPALHDVSLDIRSGELIALLGAIRLGQNHTATPYRGTRLFRRMARFCLATRMPRSSQCR